MSVLRFIRTVWRGGQDNDLWPVVLLVFAVLLPAVCLVWFMNQAMHNERLAAQHRLGEAYRGRLASIQSRLERTWTQRSEQLEELARTAAPAEAFARCIQSGMVDSAIILDGRGRILYPAPPAGWQTSAAPPNAKWTQASQLEFLRRDFAGAARLYRELSQAETNTSLAARAWQAQARCLVQAGEKNAAIQVIEASAARSIYEQATDLQGRSIVANAELFELELIHDHSSQLFQAVAGRFQARLTDYQNSALAGSQRRFLMNQLQSLCPQLEFPTLPAEELAAQFQEVSPMPARDSALHSSPITDVSHFTTPAGRVLGLLRSGRLLVHLRSLAAAEPLPADAELTLLPPRVENDSAFCLLPAGSSFPGWRLALSFKDPKRFVSATERATSIYLWTGLLVTAAMGVLGLLAVRLVRRQTALARLKNDLAATVSHELKTPLASVRVLVDTLLDSDRFQEQTVREYLQIIQQENERLSGVIQNFLTFSRMERKEHKFRFGPMPAAQIVAAAAEAVRKRFNVPDCRFEVELAADLPCVTADPNAIVTALMNLLDNAWKYSEGAKHIVLAARAENRMVLFSVRDHGIGIAHRELENIFRRFYQVDHRLSRQGSGCGLGLSIVQSIVTAHQGSTSVQSQPGCGSTFTISLPALPGLARVEKEVMA